MRRCRPAVPYPCSRRSGGPWRPRRPRGGCGSPPPCRRPSGSGALRSRRRCLRPWAGCRECGRFFRCSCIPFFRKAEPFIPDSYHLSRFSRIFCTSEFLLYTINRYKNVTFFFFPSCFLLFYPFFLYSPPFFSRSRLIASSMRLIISNVLRKQVFCCFSAHRILPCQVAFWQL